MQIRAADLLNDVDAADIVRIVSAYAADPRGGGQTLPMHVQSRLVAGLRETPTTRIWLASDGVHTVGVCVAFLGFSTFNAAPLLNIHDLAVLPGHRGKGVGAALLGAAEAFARVHGCCKLTLEVQDDNAPARGLYARIGFADVHYGSSGPTRFLSKPIIPADR